MTKMSISGELLVKVINEWAAETIGVMRCDGGSCRCPVFDACDGGV